jgi:hypothetical protein
MNPLWNALVATAWLAREAHRDYFQGSRFLILKKKGIQPQLLMWASETNCSSNGLGYVEDLTGSSGQSVLQLRTCDTRNPQDQPEFIAAVRGDAECILDALQEQIIKAQMIEFDQAKKALEKLCSVPSPQ